MNELIDFLATAGLSRRVPKGPGTYGTLVAVPLAFLLLKAGPVPYMVAVFLFMVLAIFIAQAYENHHGVHDAKEIVIDEVAGFMIAMTWLPSTWQAFLAAFVVFRTLDISKPFPIGKIDRQVKGGLGVVADDVAAGLITNFFLQVVYTHTALLGAQL
jgi:phosphatidylglycerophosphatase A